MMPISREDAFKGARLVGAAYPVDDLRRDRIKKGAFMTVDAQQPPRRHVMPRNEPELAFSKHAAAIAEIAARLEAVRQGLIKVRGK
jgi:hypothetical protein